MIEAMANNALADFITQEEDRGIGPIDRAAFDDLTAKLVKAPQLEDQTSHSASGDGSTGKRTRQGNGPCASS